MPRAIRTVGAALALCLTQGAAMGADEYRIKLHRPWKVGETVRVTTRGGETVRHCVSVEKRAPTETTSSLQASMEADVTKLAQDALGRPTRKRMKVRSLKSSIYGKAIDPLPAGSIVLATKKGSETVFELEGGKLSQDVTRLLKHVADMSAPQAKKTDDDIFGTTKRMKVGGKWAIDLKTMANEFSLLGMETNADDMTGGAKLVAVKKVRGAACLQVAIHFATSKFVVDLPAGSNVIEGTLAGTMVVTFPLDVAAPRVESSMKLNTSIKIEIPAEGDRPTAVLERSASTWTESTTVTLLRKPAVRK